jgi:hypothetical protein
MKDWVLPVTIFLVGGAILALGTAVSNGMKSNNPFEARDLLTRDMKKTPIWVFYDTSIPNARKYADFGARNSRAINIPFLNLCYQSIVLQNKDMYRIEVVDGLSGVAELLGGWKELPPKLQNPLGTLETSDVAWIRSAILAKYGGLWVAPSVICIKPFGALPDKPVFFGVDSDETFAGTAGAAVPNFYVAWSPKPEHPFWVAWEAKSRQRLGSSGGGDVARSDEKWEFLAISAIYPDIEVRPLAEASRKGPAGRRIQVEDLLSAGQEGEWPFEISVLANYVSIPWPELKDRRAFGWFLRMSEDQIAESDLVIRDLFELAQVL